jgi:hypothetical protein
MLHHAQTTINIRPTGSHSHRYLATGVTFLFLSSTPSKTMLGDVGVARISSFAIIFYNPSSKCPCQGFGHNRSKSLRFQVRPNGWEERTHHEWWKMNRLSWRNKRLKFKPSGIVTHRLRRIYEIIIPDIK